MTVPEAAQLLERNPKTVRRRIREGKVLAKKLGSQHFLEPADLVRYAVAKSTTLPLPRAWQRTRSGASMPDMTVPAVRQPNTTRIPTGTCATGCGKRGSGAGGSSRSRKSSQASISQMEVRRQSWDQDLRLELDSTEFRRCQSRRE